MKGITEKIYRYPGTVIVWRHVLETESVKMHVFGTLADELAHWGLAVKAGLSADITESLTLLANRTIQWAASIPAEIVVHGIPAPLYVTPAGVQLLADAELDEPTPLLTGEVLVPGTYKVLIDPRPWERDKADEYLNDPRPTHEEPHP